MAAKRVEADYQQAARVIAKFGGARRMGRLMGTDPTTIYKWTYPKSRGGTNGLIPAHMIPEIQKIAPDVGVNLTDADFAPN